MDVTAVQASKLCENRKRKRNEYQQEDKEQVSCNLGVWPLFSFIISFPLGYHNLNDDKSDRPIITC